MNFTVVEIPSGTTTPTSPVVQALMDNVGKAISLPVGTRDANNVRKSLRTALQNKGVLDTHTFHSKVDNANKTVIVWLAKREEKPGVTQDGSQPERMR